MRYRSRMRRKTCAKNAALHPTAALPGRPVPHHGLSLPHLRPSVLTLSLLISRILPPMALQSLQALAVQKLEPPLAGQVLKETRAALIQKPGSVVGQGCEKYVPNTSPQGPILTLPQSRPLASFRLDPADRLDPHPHPTPPRPRLRRDLHLADPQLLVHGPPRRCHRAPHSMGLIGRRHIRQLRRRPEWALEGAQRPVRERALRVPNSRRHAGPVHAGPCRARAGWGPERRREKGRVLCSRGVGAEEGCWCCVGHGPVSRPLRTLCSRGRR